MQLTSLLGHTAELVRIIGKSPQPGDALASEYFRSKKYLGATDRRFISGLVFHALRTLVLSERVAERLGLADVVHGAYVLRDNPDNVDLSWISELPIHEQVCTQEWLLDATRERWGDDAPQVWRAMMDSAPMVLRVNLRRASRERVLKQLQSDNIECTLGAISPAAIVVHQRVNLMQHPLYLSGIVEVQDEGSQLIGYAAAPDEHIRILDACAGAGGKTLHLADLQNDHGKLVAHDIAWPRLKEVSKRAARAGVRSIRVEHNATFDRPQFDMVVVDAPCSGMGTVRRLPMVKWRLQPDVAARHGAKQRAILSQYAGAVAPGGVLIYATCSILPAENEHVVAAFLAEHPEFAPDDLAPIMERMNVQIQTTGHTLQCDPLHHSTDGLFVARMRRSE